MIFWKCQQVPSFILILQQISYLWLCDTPRSRYIQICYNGIILKNSSRSSLNYNWNWNLSNLDAKFICMNTSNLLNRHITKQLRGLSDRIILAVTSFRPCLCSLHFRQLRNISVDLCWARFIAFLLAFLYVILYFGTLGSLPAILSPCLT